MSISALTGSDDEGEGGGGAEAMAVDVDPAAAAPPADGALPPAMCAARLRQLWGGLSEGHPKVTGFYSDRPNAGEKRVFSNFYTDAPFPFAIPDYCGKAALAAAGRPTLVELTFAEKGIMLCKAAVMGDYYHYDAILASQYPADSKALGRGVAPWDQARSVFPLRLHHPPPPPPPPPPSVAAAPAPNARQPPTVATPRRGGTRSCAASGARWSSPNLHTRRA